MICPKSMGDIKESMPRFRFNWDNIDPSIVKQLCDYLRLPGVDPSGELRAAYGARPREGFIEDVWSVLLKVWLPSDEGARVRIATSLRERSVGNVSIEDDLQYIESCRNTIGLRRVVLPEFITLGEVTRDPVGSFTIPKDDNDPMFGGRERIGQGEPSSNSDPAGGTEGSDRIGSGADESQTPENGPTGGISGGVDRIGGSSEGSQTSPKSPQPASGERPKPESVDHFRLWVLDTVRSAFDDQSIEPDDEGDISIPYGSVIPFITINDEPLRAEIYAVLLRDIENSEQLLKTLNLINIRLFFEKVVYVPDQKMIVLSTQLNAAGISKESLLAHIRMVAIASDYFDTQLHEQFGGRQLGTDRKADEQIV
jgi:hypothetical protein